ncbi:MAG: hypothetical protein AAF203_00680 [Pseudomonadota bacterium]
MRVVFQAIARSWSQHFVTQFSGFIIMALSYSSAFIVLMGLNNVQDLFNSWGEVRRMTVYLPSSSQGDEKKELETFFKSQKLISSFEFLSSEESSKHFEKKFSKMTKGEFSNKQISKYFPEVYHLKLDSKMAYKNGVGPLDQLIQNIRSQFPFVNRASYGQSWLERYSRFL